MASAKLCVATIGGEQMSVGTALDDALVFDHENAVVSFATRSWLYHAGCAECGQ